MKNKTIYRIIKPVCLGLIFLLVGMLSKSYAQYDSLFYSNLYRTYNVHLPSGYTGTTPLSLLIAMHGGFGSAANLEDQSLLSLKADAAHFIVVYPEGVKGTLNIRTWNAGWCCGYASNNNIDDVGFINALIDKLISTLNIDSSRIYATGMSNGGFMSYRLACELSNRIAAIAPVAASMSVPSCNPVRPVPIIQFHSYQDANVPYLGGIGSGVSNHYNSPHDSVLNAWSVKNNCVITNDTVLNNTQYTFITWHECDCLSEILYYRTTDGGHSWPGGNGTVVGDPPSAYINANDLMWDFFQLHTLDCPSPTSLNDAFTASYVSIYPNPSAGIFNIVAEGVHHYSVTDIMGKELLCATITEKAVDQINLTGYAPGIYCLKLFSAGERVEIRRILIHD